MTVLRNLRAEGLIEQVEPDLAAAAKWLDDAARHLLAAERISAVDRSGSYVLAYDAARKSVAAALLVTGYRVRNRPGSHRALARYAEHLASEMGDPAIARLDRLRRNRNRSEYGSRTFSAAEVSEAIQVARAIHTFCTSLL